MTKKTSMTTKKDWRDKIIVERVFEGEHPREVRKVEIEKRWMFRGFECIVVHMELPQQPESSDIRSWRCGYVGVPKKHRWFGKDYEKIRASVHGGLTFSQAGDGKVWTEGLHWVGFDTVHAFDTPDKWYLERAIEETIHLAKQAWLAQRKKKR